MPRVSVGEAILKYVAGVHSWSLRDFTFNGSTFSHGHPSFSLISNTPYQA